MGEFSNKRKIFENFREKIKHYDHNNSSFDWDGLKCIWEHILKLIGEIKYEKPSIEGFLSRPSII